jgi:hypothetical protein
MFKAFCWLVVQIRKKLTSVVVGGILGVIGGFMWDDIDAWVRFKVQPGNLGGDYVIKSSVFSDASEQKSSLHPLTLRQAGTRLFGTMHSKDDSIQWAVYGYSRNRFVSLAYGNVREDELGTGTYSFQKEINGIFWGHVTQVECIGQKALYTRCPALMQRVGLKESEKAYDAFMAGPCEKILMKEDAIVVAPPNCADLKQKAAALAR